MFFNEGYGAQYIICPKILFVIYNIWVMSHPIHYMNCCKFLHYGRYGNANIVYFLKKEAFFEKSGSLYYNF